MYIYTCLCTCLYIYTHNLYIYILIEFAPVPLYYWHPSRYHLNKFGAHGIVASRQHDAALPPPKCTQPARAASPLFHLYSCQ